MEVIFSAMAAPQEEFPFKVSVTSVGGGVDVSVVVPMEVADITKKKKRKKEKKNYYKEKEKISLCFKI
jgi:hypothetical protein